MELFMMVNGRMELCLVRLINSLIEKLSLSLLNFDVYLSIIKI